MAPIGITVSQDLLNGRSYDIAPDGRHFIFIAPPQNDALRNVQIVLNRFEDLKQRVP